MKSTGAVETWLHLRADKLASAAWPPRALILPALALGLALPATVTAEIVAVEPLARMTLQELANVEVTSVSKRPEQLRAAPAVLYVITHDEIMRSGATSIPEALRLAPNILVTQLGASNYVAAANGLGGNSDLQNFSNKLLVLIDGRSVYSPLFSGMYFDSQDVMMEDIDRIEVISGPGATLWGANAMNGVINIITRSAQVTDSAVASASLGTSERIGAVRYGTDLGNAAFRVYGKAFRRDSAQKNDGSDANDDWSKSQIGFRYDWDNRHDSFTLQSDAYRARENQATLKSLDITGANVVTRWRHYSQDSEFQMQGYYDLTQRQEPVGGVGFILRTYDVEIQQSKKFGTAHRVVWGAGERINDYRIGNSTSLLFLPSARTLTLGNLFAQDTVLLSRTLELTAGLKLEDDPYSGWALQPDLRLAWQRSNSTLLWAGASQAIRAPTPFDTDVEERVNNVALLTGNPSFKPERVTAYELGYRGEPFEQLSCVVSAFYNVYDNLRTIEPISSASFFPLRWGNLMEGNTYGVVTWANWQATDRWRLTPGLRYLRKQLRFKPGSSKVGGIEQAGNDPSLQAMLRSSFMFSNKVNAEMQLRYVSSLPSPAFASYYELNAHIAWQVTHSTEVSLSGNNLLHDRHAEYAASIGSEIARSVSINARWNF
jgi:iron complex outermembrane receptor protein